MSKEISRNIKEYIEELCRNKSISCSEVIEEIAGILELYENGIHITDGSGNTLFYSRESEKIDGIDANEVLGKNMRDLVKEGIFSHSIAIDVIERKERIETTQKVGKRVVFVTGIPVFKEDQVFRVIVSSKDISKLAKYENQLKELESLNETYKRELSISNYTEINENEIISKSKEMQRIKNLALRVAKVNSTVLIEGESGTGKGLLSEYIHRNSLRSELPFLKIDCSAIPENLLESELFGYESGSFTGAKEDGKIGLIELADKSTLFLDEIGELSLKLQAKLLRVIQDRVIYRVGGTEAIEVDIRIIAATNWNLLEMIKQGNFREDLYYRLSVIPIHIPPLRDRREDITPLINNSLAKLNNNYSTNKEISPSALGLLTDYDWPGNVRQLQNVIERLVVTTEEDIIQIEDIYRCNLDIGTKREVEKFDKPYKETVLDFEAELLKAFMKKSKNLNEMAQLSGLNDSTIRKKLKRMDIPLVF